MHPSGWQFMGLDQHLCGAKVKFYKVEVFQMVSGR